MPDFNKVAKHYDDVFTNSKIGITQRQMVWRYVNPILKSSKKRILEINCGTGEDAIRFANKNHDVIATDISENMIAVAKLKSDSKTILFKVQDINTISSETFHQKFDLIFSNFGGINCLSHEDLKKFINTSVTLLEESGKLVLVIMPKHCFWERIYFSLKNELKKATRRDTNQAIIANVDGVNVKTWYYNPKDVLDLAKDNYKIQLKKPIGFFVPPSYLETSFLTKKVVFSVLRILDKILNFSFLSKYSDHYLIILEKK